MIDRVWDDNFLNTATKMWSTKSIDSVRQPLLRVEWEFQTLSSLPPFLKCFEAVMNFTRSPCSPVQMLKTLEDFLPDLDGKTLLTSNADNILCHGPLARNNCNPPAAARE